MKFITGIFIIFVNIYFSLCLQAQNQAYQLNPDFKLGQYSVEHWTKEEGLPSNYLLRIFQSKNGYIWISSYNGLIQFDGMNFKVFDKNNVKQFLNSAVADVLESSDSTLWIATQSSGLVSYKNGIFKSHGLEKNIYRLHDALFIDKEDRIWAGSPDAGWFFMKNDSVEFISHSSPLKDIVIDDIGQDCEGNIWLGTYRYGLYKYNSDKSIEVFTKKNGLPDNNIFDVLCSKTGELIIGTKRGLSYYNGKTFKTDSIINGFAVYQSVYDYSDNLWVFTNKGIFRKKKGERNFIPVSQKNKLHNNYLLDAIFDFEGNLWVINYKEGLSKIKNGKFINYTDKIGLKGKTVNSICEYKNNTYLVALDNGSINIIKKNKVSEFKIPQSISGKRLRHLLYDSKQNLWISTYNGLLKIDNSGKEIMFNEKNRFPSDLIRITYEDKKGNIWVGTRDIGIVKFKGKNNYQIFDKAAGLSENLVLSVAEDKKGRLLVGTSGGGLNIISDNKIVKNYSEKNGFLSDVIFGIFVDEKNVIWTTTTKGICALTENGNSYNITAEDGLKDELCYSLQIDDYGYFWIACSRGVMKVKKSKIIDNITNKKKKIPCILFDKDDGLIQSECNSTGGMLKSKNGELWFPTLGGLSKINPKKIFINKYITPVFIEKLEADDKSKHLRENIIIEPNKRRLTFYYTGLSFNVSSKNRFKYQLIGYEKEMIDAGKRRYVSYTNLPHGNYTFKVIGCNNDGVWNTKGTSLSFYIKPYFYETVWFYILLVFFVISLFMLFHKIRIVKFKKRQEELEKIVKSRTAKINLQKDEIQAQADNLYKNNKLLVTKTEQIINQKEKIENQHKNIKDSINYAKRIQMVLFPDLELANSVFSDFFIMLKPRDVVSGDFYWIHKTEKNILFAAGDCTGHGVPGAFMSTLSISLLNQIVGERKIIQANSVLEELRRLIKYSLGQKNTNISRDGLDIAFCCLDLKTNILQYSGAYNPLYLIRHKKFSEIDKKYKQRIISEKDYNLFEIKANRQPIGIYIKESKFVNVEIQLLKNDKIYIFSDGYIDQFNEISTKKFTTKRFKKLILENHNFDMKSQKSILKKTLSEWVGKSEQIDDILVMGVKI